MTKDGYISESYTFSYASTDGVTITHIVDATDMRLCDLLEHVSVFLNATGYSVNNLNNDISEGY